MNPNNINKSDYLDLRKRLLWTALISAIAVFGLVPFNIYLQSSAHTAAEDRDRNYISIVLVESLLMFLIAFSIVNEFFTLHPDYKSLVYEHKKRNPEIPSDYYKLTGKQADGNEKKVQEENKEIDSIATAIEIQQNQQEEEEQDNDDDDNLRNKDNKPS